MKQTNNTLKVHFDNGYNAFINGRFNCKLKKHTMQYREWQRGFNTAYFDNLTRQGYGKQIAS